MSRLPESVGSAVEATLREFRRHFPDVDQALLQGKAIVVVTPAFAVNLLDPPRSTQQPEYRKRHRTRERAYWRTVDAMSRYLANVLSVGDANEPLPQTELAAIRECVARMCPLAVVVNSLNDLSCSLEMSYLHGAIGHEIFFGQHYVWWLMGHRLR